MKLFQSISFIACLAPGVLGASTLQASPEPTPLRWVVNLPQSNANAFVQRLNTQLGVPVELVRPMLQPNSYLLEIKQIPPLRALQTYQGMSGWMNALPGVAFASPDIEIPHAAVPAPNDPVYQANQAPYMNSNAYASLNMQGVWDQTRGNSGVVLAVLDSGVLFNHPELKGRLLPGYDFVSRVTPPTGTPEAGSVSTTGSNDGDGRDPDPSDPGDAPPPGAACTDGSTDSSFHGTSVASVAAAQSNNGNLMTGMDWNAKILPVRVSGRCGVATSADIVDAFYWASGSGRVDPTIGVNPNPAQVINLSFATSAPIFGGGCGDAGAASVRMAIADARALGVSVVISAGNNSGGSVQFPASCPGVIAALAAENDGQLADYSAKGNSSSALVLAAPGDSQARYVAANNSGTPTGQPDPNGHNAVFIRGTSFSAPMIAGAVSLLKSVSPGLSPGEVVDLLRSTALPFPGNANTCAGGLVRCGCTATSCGAGLLNPLGAVNALRANNPAVPLANVQESLVSNRDGGFSVDGAASTNGSGTSDRLVYVWRQVAGGPLALSGVNNPAVNVLSGVNGNIAELALTVTDTQSNRSNTSSLRVVGAGANERTAAGAGNPPSTGGGATNPSQSGSGGGAGASPAASGGGGGGGLALGGLMGLALLLGAWRRAVQLG